MWVFAAQNKPDGRLTGIADPLVERVAKWRGESGQLLHCLIENRFIDRDADGVWRLHDWAQHNPYAANAEWRRVDLQTNLIHLETHHTKTRQRRAVPLNQEARAALLNRARFRAECCPASPWVFCDRDGRRIGNVRRAFETACRRIGLEDFRIHDLRHTCAAWLVSAGVALAEIRDLLGHASITMTVHYAHLAPENVRAAVAILDSVPRSGHATSEDLERKTA